jgi:phospholipase/lecithinase/hemolysin
MPLEVGYALWAFYNQCLLKQLSQYPSVLVRFDVERSLLVEQVLGACARIGLRAEEGRVLDWYDSRLVRNPTVLRDTSPYFNAVAPVWEALLVFHGNQTI